MKKTVYLLCALLFAASTFMISSAKAQNSDLPCHGDDPTSTPPCGVPDSSTSLPINNGIIYLLIAGIAVGIVAVKKQKSVLNKA